MTSQRQDDPYADSLIAAVADKTVAAVRLLRNIGRDYSPAVFASSLGAEDQVLIDLIAREQIAIDLFSLDTGRLPAETYELLAETETRYNIRFKVYYPRHDLIENYVGQHGINGFYRSVELRKACCEVRKVEPLRRALEGKKAWITGLRAEQAATRGNLKTMSYDQANGLVKFNPLADWSETEVWTYIRINSVPYNVLHNRGYPSIGCAPCTRAVAPGDDIRSGRWWWETPETKECGLHLVDGKLHRSRSEQ
jgi:phosphoadenosine phosphosulfate reductase